MATHSFNQDSLSSNMGSKKNDNTASLPLSAMGITSLVMGILALMISWVPIINNVTFLFSILGLVSAIIAFIGIKHHKVGGRGIAYAGLFISIVSLAIMLATQSFYSAVLKGASEAVNDKSSASSTSNNNSEKAQKDDSAGNEEKSQDNNNDNKDASEGEIDNGKYHVTIKGAELSGEDYDGNPTVLVTYEVVNNQKDKTSNPFDWNVKVFQNGTAVSNHAMYVHKPKGYDSKANHLQTQIQPGGKFTYVEAFVVKDKKAPIRVEISSSWKEEDKITKEFNLS